MSVSIGRTNPKTNEYDEILVSFQTVWNDVWEKAIKDRNLHYIGCCKILHKKDLQFILSEFLQVKDYVLNHNFSDKDRNYVSKRIDEIIDNLELFWNEIPEVEDLDMG